MDKFLESAGWDLKAQTAKSLEEALKSGRTFVTDDAEKLIAANGLDAVMPTAGSAGKRRSASGLTALLDKSYAT